jgi:Tfp pilus assembly PilM family ATPase
VGTLTVKLAQAVQAGPGVRLHRAAVIQRASPWSGADAIGLQQPLPSQSEIRAALECGGFTGRNAIASLPMNVCQLRGLNVPPGTDREHRTIIANELAEDWAELPHPMEFDFWPTDSGRAEKAHDMCNVNVLAAARPWIGQLWRDCRDNGLECWALDGVPLAMARAIGLVGGEGGGRRVLAVDWGYSNTTLCVVSDNRPLYSRRLNDCRFGAVLETVVSDLDVTLDEAQHLVDRYGLPGVAAPDAVDTSLQTAIADAAAATLDELVLQIERTLQFMETQRRHLQPSAIWLMGGGASMRNVREHLDQALPLPVHIWTVPADGADIPCAAGPRAAIFGEALALSAAAWRAA